VPEWLGRLSRVRRKAAQRKRAVQREQHGGYTCVRNEVLEDGSLLPESRSVLFYLTAKPDGWIVRTADIMRALGMSEHAVTKIARPELTEAGYLLVDYTRVNGRIVSKQTLVNRKRIIWDDSESPGRNHNVVSPPDGETTPLVTTHRVVTTDTDTGSADTDELPHWEPEPEPEFYSKRYESSPVFDGDDEPERYDWSKELQR
jgi:hypothetical protein